MFYFKSPRIFILFVTLAVSVAACDEDPLDPNVTGIVEAVVQDNPQLVAADEAAMRKGSTALTGTAAGNMNVSMRSTGGDWIDVGSPNGITVNLQSSSGTTVHGPTSVPVGSFDRVRLTISAVQVTVKAGSVIGGTTIGGDMKSMIASDSPLVVEKSVATFETEEGGRAVILFELNSEDWLSVAALTQGQVASDKVRSSVTVVVGG